MKLINADELITAFPCGESVRTESVRATINHMPTIEVSEDCISRKWLEKNFQTVCENARCNECPFDNDDCRLADFIINAPSVVPKDHSGEATEMVGEWIKEMHTNKVQIWKCDQCAEMIEQSIQYEYPRWNYCPNCGAKMKGIEE